MINFSNIYKTLKSFYFNLTQVIFTILGFSQLAFLCLYLEENHLFLLLIHITLIETLFISYKTIHKNKLLFIYGFYLLIKYIFSFYLYSGNSSYVDYYLLMSFQLIFFFFNIDTVEIYRKKMMIILSVLSITCLSIIIFIQNVDLYSYLFLIYITIIFYILKNKVSREENRFCQNKQFTPNMMLRDIKRTPISFASILLLSFIATVSQLELNSFSKVILMMILLVVVVYEFKQLSRVWQIKFDIYKIFKYYIPIIIFIVVYLLLSWLIDIEIVTDANGFSEYSSNIFNTISNIAILNIASLFIILQLNYSKYGSSYLLYKILKSPILLLITFFPSIIYISSFYFLNLDKEQYYIIPSILILSYLSTLGLFFYTYFFMETHNLMKKLFEDVQYEDFNTYKNNIISTKEKNLDSILTIINRIINNNDTPSSHSLFFYLFCWVDINISHIKDQDRFYQTQENNRFYDFFILIIQNIVTSNNLIQKNFLIAIKEMIIYKVNSDNYMNYSLIYRVLFSYLKLSLKNKNEEIPKLIYDVIYWQTSNILLNLKRFELTDSEILDKDNDYATMHDFESVFIESLYSIQKTAINNEQKEFLSHCRLNHSFFFSIDEKGNYEFSKWDGKVIEIYKRLKGIRHDTNQYIVKNIKFYSIYLNDYEHMFMINEDTEIYKYELLQKYIFDELVGIYLYAIENDAIKSEHDFHVFWSSILRLNYRKNSKLVINLISVFTYLFDKLAEKYINDKENEYIVNSVFQRVLQVKSYDKELNLETRRFINDRVKNLLKKYPRLNDFVNKDRNTKSSLVRNIDLINDFEIKRENNALDYQI